MMKGYIGLDVDGTITADKYSVPKEVQEYFAQLTKQGWKIVILTGRTYTYGKVAISSFSFPFYFSAQNGSVLFEMPGEKCLMTRYMPPESIEIVEEAFAKEDGDFLVYSGYETGDFCYYRPKRFNEEETRYIEALKARQKEAWKACDEFPKDLKGVPLIKGFGPEKHCRALKEKLLQKDLFHIAVIRDPFIENFSILHITRKDCSKGDALKHFAKTHPIIAAGDDENDLSMFEVADVSIAMPSAPDHVRQAATIIAPPAKEMGIIDALKLTITEKL